MNKPIIVLGSGGHASVLIETLRLLDKEITGIADPEIKKGTLIYDDIPVLGTDESVKDYRRDEVYLVNGIGPSPKTIRREQVSKNFQSLGYEFLSIIHPSAIVSTSVNITSGVQIMAKSVIQTGSSVGFCSVINTGGIIDHDCKIGDFSHISPGSILCGGIETGTGVYIGAGSVVLENLSLGDNSLVAAGTTLRKNLKPKEKYYGD